MSGPSVFLNCSMPAINYGLREDLVHSSFNMTRIESAIVTKVAGFGVLVAFLINFLFHFETNYYFLKLCSILPNYILRPAFDSNQATMVLSNMPLKSLVFFIPNKGNTGLGIKALGYDGVLRFGAMADSAIISSPEKLDIILNGMVKGIKRLHKNTLIKSQWTYIRSNFVFSVKGMEKFNEIPQYDNDVHN